MNALDSFLADPWATISAYWQTVPSHVRILVSFLITRTISESSEERSRREPTPAPLGAPRSSR